MASDHPSAKTLLKAALQKANDAVSFDYRHNFEDAIRAYGDACSLIGQVMRISLHEGDRDKLEAIVRILAVVFRFSQAKVDFPQRVTYIRRIFELQGCLAPVVPKL